MIYRLRIFGREIGSLEIVQDAEPDQRQLPEVGGGASHNFEMSYTDPESQGFGFRA